MDERPKFTNVQYEMLEPLGISIHDYCIADMIHSLASSNNSTAPGWCYASKDYLAKCARLTQRTIFNIIANLIDKGILEKNEETSFLRTSAKWQTLAYFVKNLHTKYEKISEEGMKNFPKRYEKISYNNNIYKNKDNNNDNQENDFSQNLSFGKELITEKTEQTEPQETTNPKEEKIDSPELLVFVDRWNKFAGEYGLSKILALPDKREKALKARLKEKAYDIDKIYEKIKNSDFLLGKSSANFRVTFDFITKNTGNYVKILEGNYDNNKQQNSNNGKYAAVRGYDTPPVNIF